VHSALDAGSLDVRLRLARIRGIAIALLVNTPHVNVEDDNGRQLYAVADKHAAQGVSAISKEETTWQIDLRDVRRVIARLFAFSECLWPDTAMDCQYRRSTTL